MSEEQEPVVESDPEEQQPAVESGLNEQRSCIRFRINAKVVVRLSSGDLVRTQGKNISKGGIYVEFEAPADLGDEFEMMFDLVFTDEIKRIYAKARVQRSELLGGRDVYGIGFQFLSFAKNTGEILDKYLELREMKQGSAF
jgi:PilZ domain